MGRGFSVKDRAFRQMRLRFGATGKDSMATPTDTVGTYIRAKDGNRPFLMRQAFVEDAELEMVVRTQTISFPKSSKGRAAIEEILVRRFAIDFENVHTFCLSQPSAANRHHFPCHWLVGMSGKSDGQVRVGCGRYDWHFTADARCLTNKLIITIDLMQVFPGAGLDASMAWLAGLPYPWCAADIAARSLPPIDALAPVARYLEEVRPILPER
jgi:hypothetical protein